MFGRDLAVNRQEERAMGRIVRLTDRVRRRAAAQQATAPLAPRVYFCMRCDASRFLLYPEGSVQCACCGARIDNLCIAESASSPG
jgi:hypothetical protein